jgi:type VI secretion system secreted protein Hcp
MKTQKIYRVLFAAALFQFIALVSSAQVTAIYTSITGTVQGDIKSDAIAANKAAEGKIECLSFTSELQSPRDAATGLPSGKRLYKPVTLTMHFDGSTPKLLKAASTNEILKTVKIEFMKPNTNGVVGNFATVTLTNATIASIEEVVENKTTSDLVKSSFVIKISLTFQKIETDSMGGTPSSMSDTWSATVQ